MNALLRLGVPALLVLGLLASATTFASAQAGSVTVTVRCLPNPEQITVRNSTGAPLAIQRITSSGGPVVEGEPIDVGDRLPAAAVIPNDQTVIYENGPNAAGNVLLADEIFDDTELANEKLVLTTDRGTFEMPCGSGTNTQTFSIGGSPGPSVPVGIGTAMVPVQATAASAQATAAAAAATVGSAAQPVQSIAGTVTAPAQATIASGVGNVATAIPPQFQTAPNIPPPAVGGAQIANTPTPASPVARQGAAGSISGVVFNDLNRNGVLDAGEEGIGSVTITLLAPGPDRATGTADDTTVATTVTGGDGRYGYVGVTPGPYTVVETDPPGAISTTSNSVAITVGAAAAVVNFGDYLEPTAGAAPAQAGGISPLWLLPLGGLLIVLGVWLGRRPRPVPQS